MLARIRHSKRGMNSRDAATDDENIRINRNAPLFETLVKGNAPCGSAHKVHRFGGGSISVLVYPRDMLANIYELKKEGIDSSPAQNIAEGLLVQHRRTRSHYDPVELMISNISADDVLARIRTHVL